MELHLIANEKSGKYLSLKVLSSLSIMHIDVVSQAILISFAVALNKALRGFSALNASKTTLQI